MEMVNSFTSPALRYCRMRSAPPPIRMSRPPAAILARARALSMLPNLIRFQLPLTLRADSLPSLCFPLVTQAVGLSG